MKKILFLSMILLVSSNILAMSPVKELKIAQSGFCTFHLTAHEYVLGIVYYNRYGFSLKFPVILKSDGYEAAFNNVASIIDRKIHNNCYQRLMRALQSKETFSLIDYELIFADSGVFYNQDLKELLEISPAEGVKIARNGFSTLYLKTKPLNKFGGLIFYRGYGLDLKIPVSFDYNLFDQQFNNAALFIDKKMSYFYFLNALGMSQGSFNSKPFETLFGRCVEVRFNEQAFSTLQKVSDTFQGFVTYLQRLGRFSVKILEMRPLNERICVKLAFTLASGESRVYFVTFCFDENNKIVEIDHLLIRL